MTQLYEKIGKRYYPVSTSEMSGWDGFMAMAAVRYCLGRSSYAPGVAMDWCCQNWSRMIDNDRHVIVRAVIQWLADRCLWDKDGDPVMEDYRNQWTDFALSRLELCTDEQARTVVRSALHSEEHRKAPEAAPFLKWIEK